MALILGLYIIALWVRDRKFPLQDRPSRELDGEGSAHFGNLLRTKITRPWTLVVVALVIVGASLAVVTRAPGLVVGTDAGRLAYKIGVLGVIVPTIALLAARIPRSASEMLTEWWIPAAVLLLISVLSSILLPDVVLTIMSREAVRPDTAAMLILPVAAFILRAMTVLKVGPRDKD